MVLVLHLVSYVAGLAAFCFALLSLANGLLYVAEVIEEHSAFAKTVGQRIIYAEIVLFGLLYTVDGLPLHLVAVGVVAHLIYLQNFSRQWPVISVKSLTFVLSCIVVLVSHYLSFRHFSSRSLAAATHHGYPRYDPRKGRYASQGQHTESFLEVATYFGVCVWLVPFYLFLSLSANDNVLPSSGETSASSSRRPSATTSSSPSLSVPASHPSRSPDSPTLGRHARHRSSMMKSALSSAFSIIPSSLRPSTLSNSLPLSNATAGPRMDVPRSPSPTFGFQPYSSANGGGSVEAREAYAASASSSATQKRPHLSLMGRQGSNDRFLAGGGASMSPTSSHHPALSPAPSSPRFSPSLHPHPHQQQQNPLSTSLPPSLSIHAPSPSSPSSTTRSGSALPPSLSPSNPRFPAFPSPQSPAFPPGAGPGQRSQPPSPAQARFTRPLPPAGGGPLQQQQQPPPGMVRRHTAQLVQQQHPAPPPAQGQGQGQAGGLGRRASEAQGLRGRFGGAAGGAEQGQGGGAG